MKKAFLISLCVALVLVASAAELKEPVFRMTEPELLAVLKENGLNDKVTACQELSHVGTSAAVPALAAFLTDATEPALFLAARYALENVPGGEAETALKCALAVVTDAKRRGGIEKSLRARTNPIPDGYANASEKLTAFPPKNAVQKGDLAAVPALVEAALGTGPAATLARRHLVGFPNDGIVDVLLGLLEGADVKKARLALDVLGTRRVRVEMSRLFAFARTTKHEGLRMEAFKAFATLCDPEDLPQLLALLKEFPKADRLSGSIIRVVARAFEMDTTPITVIKAEYGFFGTPRQVADIIGGVRALVGGGSRTIMASNHLAGQGGFPFDPAPGKHKELHLTYRLGDGPELSAIVQECGQIKFTDCRLPESLAKQLVSAAQAATGDERAALVCIIDTLDRRGIVPGADMVLFRPIFNGKDLTGWSQKDGYFSVKDGVITGESTPDHLCKPNHHLVYTAEELTDFELRAEFRLSKGANSGIQLRLQAAVHRRQRLPGGHERRRKLRGFPLPSQAAPHRRARVGRDDRRGGQEDCHALCGRQGAPGPLPRRAVERHAREGGRAYDYGVDQRRAHHIGGRPARGILPSEGAHRAPTPPRSADEGRVPQYPPSTLGV